MPPKPRFSIDRELYRRRQRYFRDPDPDGSVRLHIAVTLLILGATPPSSTQAQQPTWNASVGAAHGSWRAATGASWDFPLSSWLQIGLGPRLTRFGGATKSYRSHGAPAGLPARLPLAPNVWALNLAIAAEVRPIAALALGGNLDLAGLAFGPERDRSGLRVAPARWSLFRYGDRDHGSLNSEAYLSLHLTPVAVRLGISHFITGYRAVGQGSTRYLRFDTVPFVSLTWTP